MFIPKRNIPHELSVILMAKMADSNHYKNRIYERNEKKQIKRDINPICTFIYITHRRLHINRPVTVEANFD